MAMLKSSTTAMESYALNFECRAHQFIQSLYFLNDTKPSGQEYCIAVLSADEA